MCILKYIQIVLLNNKKERNENIKNNLQIQIITCLVDDTDH